MQSYSTSSTGPLNKSINGVPAGTVGFYPKDSEVFTVLADHVGNGVDPNPHHFIKVVENHPFGDSYYYDTWGGGYLYGQHKCQGGSYSNGQEAFHSNNGADVAYQQALARLYGKIRNSSLNIDVDAFEGRETARMIRNTIKAVRGIKSFTKQAIKDIKKDPTLSASNAWLQYKYGWSPLVGTIYDALEFHSKEWPKYNVRARGKASSYDGAEIATGGYYSPDRSVVESGSYRTQIDLTYQVTDVESFALDRIATLDPASIIWELTPYSFVADWFYNIGEYLKLKEMATSSNLSFVKGYRTDTRFETQAYLFTGKYYVSPWQDEGKWRSWSMVGSRVRKEKERTLLTSMPYPVTPSVKCDLGSSQLISAAALLRQLFS